MIRVAVALMLAGVLVMGASVAVDLAERPDPGRSTTRITVPGQAVILEWAVRARRAWEGR